MDLKGMKGIVNVFIQVNVKLDDACHHSEGLLGKKQH